jgi:hypothetical protein
VDGRDGKALGGVGVPFGVVKTFWLAQPPGSLHPGGQPIHHDRLADLSHLGESLAKLVEAGDEGAVGLAQPEISQRTKQQV